MGGLAYIYTYIHVYTVYIYIHTYVTYFCRCILFMHIRRFLLAFGLPKAAALHELEAAADVHLGRAVDALERPHSNYGVRTRMGPEGEGYLRQLWEHRRALFKTRQSWDS